MTYLLVVVAALNGPDARLGGWVVSSRKVEFCDDVLEVFCGYTGPIEHLARFVVGTEFLCLSLATGAQCIPMDVVRVLVRENAKDNCHGARVIAAKTRKRVGKPVGIYKDSKSVRSRVRHFR